MPGASQRFSDSYIHSLTRSKFKENHQKKKKLGSLRQDVVNDSLCPVRRIRTRAATLRQDIVDDMVFEIRGANNPNNIEFTGFTYFVHTKEIKHAVNISKLSRQRPRIYPSSPDLN